MKFSYPLIKKLIPGVKSKRELIEALTMHSFEAEDARGDAFEVSLPPNRYSDAASHWGIAREAAATLGLKKIKIPLPTPSARESDFAKLRVKVADKTSCPRYSAQCFENVRVGQSPAWMQKILESCGLRAINSVVDIMNYAMLETGQPLHAFDYDKLEGKDRRSKMLMVRRAKKGERVVSLDKTQYFLTPEMLVIADARRPLAIAGIKGGISAEVTPKTKRIIIESANFESTSIYRTSRILNLRTDASQRFSHGLSPRLTAVGLDRAAQLLQDLAGAHAGLHVDILSRSLPRAKIIFEIDKISKLLGIEIPKQEIAEILGSLGFTLKETKDKQGKRFLECLAPAFRLDVSVPEDIVEEIARIYGYQKIRPVPPSVSLRVPEQDRVFETKDAARSFLAGVGFDEVYNYSMEGTNDQLPITNNKQSETVRLENPISNEFSQLRSSLVSGLMKNIEHNGKFFDEVKIFEIGRVFSPKKQKKSDEVEEKTMLAFTVSGKKESFFEVKGIAQALLERLGVGDTDFKEIKGGSPSLGVWSSRELLGMLVWADDVSVAELNVEKIAELASKEVRYREIPKFPSVSRDTSFLVSAKEKIGAVIDMVSSIGAKLIRRVDLVDEYRGDKWPGLQSLTLRATFRADDRTLTSEEVDREMKKITDLLQKKFKAKLR